MENIQIHVPGVEKLLRNIDPSKATGPDGIQAIILKESATEISALLTHIFTQSIRSGTLPHDWKEANISPVFKKGDKTKSENDRPISLTSIACKILEHIVVSTIMKHLDNHNILSSCQHGFRRNHSCETQLILTSQDIARAYTHKKQMDMILLDISKAFDKVPHNRLLLKMNHYGMQGQTLSWIKAFLTGRIQSVVFEGAKSEAVPVISGVPQGTVLGPTLFLLYINDLPLQVSSSTTKLFADDCIVYREIDSPADAKLLQHDLDALQNWERIHHP